MNNVLNGINAIILAGDFDKDGNFIKGNVIPNNTKNSYLRTEKRLLATINEGPSRP